MAKKTLFLTQKEAAKFMQSRLYETVIAAGSGIASSLFLNKVRSNIDNVNAQKMVGRFGGVVLLGAGGGAHVFARDPLISAAGLGVATIGAAQTIMDLKPDFGANFSFIKPVDLGSIDNYDDAWEQDEEDLGAIDQEQSFDIISQIAEKIDKGEDPNQLQFNGPVMPKEAFKASEML